MSNVSISKLQDAAEEHYKAMALNFGEDAAINILMANEALLVRFEQGIETTGDVEVAIRLISTYGK